MVRNDSHQHQARPISLSLALAIAIADSDSGRSEHSTVSVIPKNGRKSPTSSKRRPLDPPSDLPLPSARHGYADYDVSVDASVDANDSNKENDGDGNANNGLRSSMKKATSISINAVDNIITSNNKSRKSKSSNKKQKKRRNVTFYSSVRVKTMPRYAMVDGESSVDVDSSTNAETHGDNAEQAEGSNNSSRCVAHDIWYTKPELKGLRRDARETVMMMHKDELPYDTHEYCRRGLEIQLPARAEQRKLVRQTARDVVLEKQEQLRKDSIVDEDAIADVYTESTIMSQVTAQHIGMMDHRDAWMQ